MSPPTIVVGVGNSFRGDDGAGIEVARHVRDLIPSRVNVVEHDGEPAGLLDIWDGADLAVVVDAVWSGQVAPGEVHRVEVRDEHDLKRGPSVSSHSAGPGQAVELARALDRLPRRLVLYGIEGKNFSPGLGLSPEVETAVAGIVGRIVEEVQR